MCGLWGLSGKKGKAINFNKLMVLGLFNQPRGTDSCGYYCNGHIDKGIGIESHFDAFIAKNQLKAGTLKTKVFMGHTRKSTCGQHNFENAHPHVVNNNLVQTHNGKIEDIWKLCNKYNVNHTKIHVDSIGLAELIAQEGPKKILDEYKGTAALAFTYMEKPEALYLYHGASKEKVDGEVVTERPLWFLRQPEGIYYSSLPSSLEAIKIPSEEEDMQVFSLKPNNVWEIIDGKFTGDYINIEREENNISTTVTPVGGNSYQNTLFLPPASKPLLGLPDIITQEAPPLNVYGNNVYYFQGRFYKVEKRFYKPSWNSITILHGKYIIARTGYISDSLMPKDGREEEFYFLNGIMIKSEREYQTLKDNSIFGGTLETFKLLSESSKYPIFHHNASTSAGTNLWYHKGKIVSNDTFCPKFSGKHYKIHQGRTSRIY